MTGRLRFTPALVAYGLASEIIWLALLAFTPNLAYQDDQALKLAVMVLGLILLGLCGLAWNSLKQPRLPGDLAVILVFSAVFAVTLTAFWQPRGSTDLAGYVFYGRAAAVYGDNAYIAVPDNHPLDPIYPYVASCWRQWKNPYGPAWTGLSAVIAAVSGDQASGQMIVFKTVTALFYFGCLALIWLIARKTLLFPPV